MTEREPPYRPLAKSAPAKTSYLHVRSVEDLLGEAAAITGNTKALLQPRAQIDRALKNEGAYPFEEGVYQDVHGIPFEVAVKRARGKRLWPAGSLRVSTASVALAASSMSGSSWL